MKSIFLFFGLFLKIHFILSNPIFVRLNNGIKTSLNINETEYYFFIEAKQNQFVNISYWNYSSTLECEDHITFYELKIDNEPEVESYNISQSLNTYSFNFEYDAIEKHYWKGMEVIKNKTNYIGFKLNFLSQYNNDNQIEIKVDCIGSNLYLENNKEFILNNIKSKTPYFLYIQAKNLDIVNLQLTINYTGNNPLLANLVSWYLFNNISLEHTTPIPIDINKDYIKDGNEFRFSFSHTVEENYSINYIAFKLMTAYDVPSVVAKYNVKDNNTKDDSEKEESKNDDNENSDGIIIKLDKKTIIIIGIVAVLVIIVIIICCIICHSRKKPNYNEMYRTKDSANPLLPAKE